MQPRFVAGQLVALRADPMRVGPVIAVLQSPTGAIRYRVYHSPTEIREYQEEQLESVGTPDHKDELVEAVRQGRWLDPLDFAVRLTAARLAHPLVDTLYALHAARIRSIPFQFKPVLRLLRGDRPRILIADEVGVGKTIEAGLILKELEARQRVDNVLVLCPKALVSKWRAEMRRFDEEFRVLTAESLRYCLREADLDGAWPEQYSRAIAPLELLRVERYLEGTNDRRRRTAGLLTLDPAPQFSLVIVDEAHHLRNPETRSHLLGQFLCEAAEAVVFLSATPVHLGSENLFALLNLLRPDLFLSQAILDRMLESAPHITAAMRRVRAGEDDWQRGAVAALDAASATEWGREVVAQDPRFTDWRRQLGADGTVDDADRIRCLRDLEELHPLAHVMNRTRRRDIGRFTIREPHTVSIAFTAEQEHFYHSLIEFRRAILQLEHDPSVVRLILDMLERQAASCLPALAASVERVVGMGSVSMYDLTDDPDVEDEEATLPAPLIRLARELVVLARQLPPDDPKLDGLLTIVESSMQASGPNKLLVFSYFLHTLDYLEPRLRAAGCRVAQITGRTPDDERELLRDRFRLPHPDPDAIDVLLSSEVGCEGLDYEFCDRLVNYDIPWNPMRIEQRIGRIDRFGQTADKVLVYNFITPGTVEERVFFRCFERLGIFRDTIGDLEAVLGEVIQELTRVALDPSLTPAQAEERGRQAADNLLRRTEETRRVEEEAAGLLGLDQLIREEVDTLEREGRVVTPSQLQQLVERYLQTLKGSYRLTPIRERPQVQRLGLGRETRLTLISRIRELGRQDRTTREFLVWLEGDERHLDLTFDQETAAERRDLAFITPFHPLVRAAISEWSQQAHPLATSLVLRAPEVGPGIYVFASELWESVAATPEVRLVTLAWHVEGGVIDEHASITLGTLLERPDTERRAMTVANEEVVQALEQIEQAFDERRRAALDSLHERNDALVARRLASLDGFYQQRLGRVEDELRMTRDERILRMKRAERSRVEREYAERRQEIETRRSPDIIRQRLAAGVVEILDAE